MHRRIPHLASRLPIVALLSLSCATLGRLAFTEPDVELQEIAVTGIGVAGGTFELASVVYNPNAYPLPSTPPHRSCAHSWSPRRGTARRTRCRGRVRATRSAAWRTRRAPGWSGAPSSGSQPPAPPSPWGQGGSRT